MKREPGFRAENVSGCIFDTGKLHRRIFPGPNVTQAKPNRVLTGVICDQKLFVVYFFNRVGVGDRRDRPADVSQHAVKYPFRIKENLIDRATVTRIGVRLVARVRFEQIQHGNFDRVRSRRLAPENVAGRFIDDFKRGHDREPERQIAGR